MANRWAKSRSQDDKGVKRKSDESIVAVRLLWLCIERAGKARWILCGGEFAAAAAN